MKYLALLVVTMLSSAGYSFQAKPDSVGRKALPYSVSLQLGTSGVGLYCNHVFNQSRRLAVRVGGQYVAYRKPIRIETAPDSYIGIDPDLVISVLQASLKWNPFPHNSFFIVGGLGYTWHPAMRFVITANDKLNLGGLELTPQDVGVVKLGVQWRPIIGYVGWGFGQTMPRKRFGIGFEMGVYYLGRPSINLDYEGFLETTTIDEQVPVVERNLSGYRYLPSINLTLTYALHRSR